MKDPKVSRWVLSQHALERIEERSISALEIAEVVANPDLKIPQGPKWIFAKTFSHRNDNRVAAVLLEKKEQNLWVILTVMIHFEEK